MASIFLRYRRADSAGYAGRLAEDLQRQLGEALVSPPRTVNQPEISVQILCLTLRPLFAS